jgi:hypothetical protein
LIAARSSQLAALEKAKADKEARGELESECPGYCGAQDTFHVGTLKGAGRVYQQTFIDTYAIGLRPIPGGMSAQLTGSASPSCTTARPRSPPPIC